jgi:hypothetical protein
MEREWWAKISKKEETVIVIAITCAKCNMMFSSFDKEMKVKNKQEQCPNESEIE